MWRLLSNVASQPNAHPDAVTERILALGISIILYISMNNVMQRFIGIISSLYHVVPLFQGILASLGYYWQHAWMLLYSHLLIQP